jgi:hypothetical protein
MNTDRPTDTNVSLASEEQLDEVRAVFDKALTRLFRGMNPERAQSFITNKEALSSVLGSIDLPLVVNKGVFHIYHEIPLEKTFTDGTMKVIRLDNVHPMLDLCAHSNNTTVAVIKIFQDGVFSNLIDKIHSIGFNTGCLRSVLYASMRLINIGQWMGDTKIITPYQISGKDFLYFVFEREEGKTLGYCLSMKSFPADQSFKVDNHLFVGVKNAD